MDVLGSVNDLLIGNFKADEGVEYEEGLLAN